VLNLWSCGHLTCDNIARAHNSYLTSGNKSSITKHLHITRAIKPAGNAKEAETKFSSEKYNKITSSLAVQAAGIFNTEAAMETYYNTASAYRPPSTRKPKASKTMEEKVAILQTNSIGAKFLKMSTTQTKK
jgi:hypothetical protein